MFAKPDEHMPYATLQFTGALYIATDDVEALWLSMKDTPPIFYGPEMFDYGMKEFAIEDGNGYILQFGQEVQA